MCYLEMSWNMILGVIRYLFQIILIVIIAIGVLTFATSYIAIATVVKLLSVIIFTIMVSIIGVVAPLVPISKVREEFNGRNFIEEIKEEIGRSYQEGSRSFNCST